MNAEPCKEAKKAVYSALAFCFAMLANASMQSCLRRSAFWVLISSHTIVARLGLGSTSGCRKSQDCPATATYLAIRKILATSK